MLNVKEWTSKVEETIGQTREVKLLFKAIGLTNIHPLVAALCSHMLKVPELYLIWLKVYIYSYTKHLFIHHNFIFVYTFVLTVTEFLGQVQVTEGPL